MFEMQLVDEDAEMIVKVVNQGIDYHLDGICHSEFEWYVHMPSGEMPAEMYMAINSSDRPAVIAAKLHCQIADGDMSVLLRRLIEACDIKGNFEAGQLADDIVRAKWGLESRDA